MEAGRVSERDAPVRGGDSGPSGQLHGSQPVFERIVGSAGRNYREAGFLS